MPMRLILLPADLTPLADVVVESFQYPENEAWSVQHDERQEIVAAMGNLRRLWPIIRLIQFLSPPLRDILRGHVWEEGGRIAGTCIVQRRGATSVWVVGTVGVLPAYRRRGLARQLVQAGLDLIRAHGGSKAILNVIDGNMPAYTLYEQLGFEHYGGTVELDATPQQGRPAPRLPEGYRQSRLDPFDWRPRFELEERITPPHLLRYEPVEEGRFRQPQLMRLLGPLLAFAQAVREESFVIRTAAGGQVVAWGRCATPTRGAGLNHIGARLDPAHAALAPYLVEHMLHQVTTRAPGRRVEFSVARWMGPLVTAAEAAGLQRRLEYCRMGMEL